MKVVTEDGYVFDLTDLVPLAVRGEARVYVVGGFILKIYKRPTDIGIAGNARKMEAARNRLRDAPGKLVRFPLGMPTEVVAPWTRLYDSENGEFAGFVMELVEGITLHELMANPDTDMDFLMTVFKNLGQVVRRVHAAGAVIGDFSPSNILVLPDGSVHLIDADSMQYRGYAALGFTEGYIDLRRYGSQHHPHTAATQMTDWYAYDVLLFEALFRIKPFDGIQTVNGEEVDYIVRLHRRTTVMDPRVTVPTMALSFRRVPAYVMDYFVRVFEHDVRAPFPPELLDLQWSNCPTHKLSHARRACYACLDEAAAVRLSHQERTGFAGIKRAPTGAADSLDPVIDFETKGTILAASYHHGRLRVLYREGGVMFREHGRRITPDPQRAVLYGISGGDSVFGYAESLVVSTLDGRHTSVAVSTMQNVPVFATNSQHTFIVYKETVTTAKPGERLVDGVTLPSAHTVLWAGEDVGLALSRTREGADYTVFTANTPRPQLLKAATALNPTGYIGQTACYFGQDRIWLLAKVTRGDGSLRTLICVLDNSGQKIHQGLYPHQEYMKNVLGHAASSHSLFMLYESQVIELVVAGTGTAKTAIRSMSVTKWPIRFVSTTSALVIGWPGEGHIIGMQTIIPITLPSQNRR